MPQADQPTSGAFGIPEAAALVGWSAARLRRLVRDGVLIPTLGSRGELRLSFRDLTLLRRLRELGDGAQVTSRRVHRALARLRESLPKDDAISQVSISAAGREVVVRDDACLWSPESGQCHLDFTAPGQPRSVPLAARVTALRSPVAAHDAEEWAQLGVELEADDPTRARDAYRAALELDPNHADAHVNLGCLEHEAGELARAEAHYRAALSARPGDATAHFNLAVALEDQRRFAEARETYEAALLGDPSCAEAHHNLARLCERLGDRTAALRHWVALRRLVLDAD